MSTPIILLHEIFSDYAQEAETLMHGLFEDRRCNGEWFDLYPEDARLLFAMKYIYTQEEGVVFKNGQKCLIATLREKRLDWLRRGYHGYDIFFRGSRCWDRFEQMKLIEAAAR